MNLNGVAAIVGIGETPYSRNATESALEFQLRASLLAIEDAGLQPSDIDGLIPIFGVPAEEYVHNLGLTDVRFSGLVLHGGASAVHAIQMAAAAVATGIATTVLVPTGRNISNFGKAGVRIHQMRQFHCVTDFELPIGAIAPAQLYAPMARRHMELYGTTSRQLAEIAVTVRAHALLNDHATMRTPITVDDHQNSRMIADPFRLLDCSLESDGGAAYIVTTPERARDLRHLPVILRGAGFGLPDSPSAITQRADMTTLGVAKAAPIAFAMAGISHDDIDVAEIYDCFTWVVLCQLEDLGFCAKGEGGPFVEDGRLRLGGPLPTNTHGGLLSQGHMLGMNHVVELVRQLRGDGGAAQVEGARVGLVTGYGDLGDGAVAILEGV